MYINGLDLFSGIGGVTIALESFVRPVAYCENDKYAQSVLLSRMYERKIPTAPIWDNVKTLSGHSLREYDIQIIYGGFPCQDISVAGNGEGLEGKRSSLFYEIIRLTKEIEPCFVFLENVPAIRTRGLHEVVKAFTEIRYDCRWTCVTASSVGANHRRERWFLLAHSNSSDIRLKQRWSIGKGWEREIFSGDNGQKKSVDDSNSNTSFREIHQLNEKEIGLQNINREENSTSRMFGGADKKQRKKPMSGFKKSNWKSQDWWKTEPNVGRVVDELPNRVDRIKCLGNAVVPMQVKKAFEKLIGMQTGDTDG